MADEKSKKDVELDDDVLEDVSGGETEDSGNNNNNNPQLA